ncbi:MAG: hypothetical protein ACE5K3_02300 [bacterium]
MDWNRGLNEEGSQWAWEPMVHSGGTYSQRRGEILRQEIYDCAFCKGTGERPRGSKCPVCKGEGTAHVKPPAVVCAFCKGRGEEKPRSTLTCSACRGKGVVSVKEPIKICPTCSGRGRQIGSNLYCMSCKGTGVVTVKTGKEGDNIAMVRRPGGSEWEALHIIYELGRAGRNGVGGRMHVSASYAEYVLKSLLNKQLIKKENRDIYVLSQAGKKIFEKMKTEKPKPEEKKTEEELEKINTPNLQEYKIL